jgi:hypothetical protein
MDTENWQMTPFEVRLSSDLVHMLTVVSSLKA